MAKLPLNFTKISETWKEAGAQAARPVEVVLTGDPELIGLAQERFSLGGAMPVTRPEPVSRAASLASEPGDVVVVFVPGGNDVEIRALLEQGGAKKGTIIAVDEGGQATGKSTYLGSGYTRLSFADTPAGWRRLYGLCAKEAGNRVVALGNRYPVLKEAAAREVVHRTSGQNALIGLAFFARGADMPAMTLNQARMVLSIAGVYGEAIDRERVVELAGVVGTGFALRAVGRRLSRSSPRLGWAVKAAIGYSATRAMGALATRYFAKGAPVSTSRVVALAGSLKR